MMGLSENSFYIESREDALDIKRFYNKASYLIERSEILEDQLVNNLIQSEEYITEASDIASKITGAIGGIFKKMKELINTMLEKFSELLNNSGSKNMTPEDYLNSDTGKMEFNCDIKKYTDNCDKALTEGQKLLRQIGADNDIPEEKIRLFERICERAKKATPAILTLAVAGIGARYTFKKVSSWNKIISDAEKETYGKKGSIYKSKTAQEYRKGRNPETGVEKIGRTAKNAYNAYITGSPVRQEAREALDKEKLNALVLKQMAEVINAEKQQSMSFFQKLYTKKAIKNKMINK